MSAIFLSASVPVVGRGNYYETADPFLIQFAVRQLVTATIRDQKYERSNAFTGRFESGGVYRGDGGGGSGV